MPKLQDEPSRSRRTHTFGGCSTCRRRHVKCDQVKPTCLTCQAVGIACAGYHTQLKWIAAPGTSNENEDIQDESRGTVQTARTHLYSEDSRASMSTALLSDLSAKPVDESLLELDNRSKEASMANGKRIAVGPFGVFSIGQMTAAGDETSIDAGDENIHAQADPTEKTPQTVESSESLTYFQDWLDWPDLFDLDFNFPNAIMPDSDNIFDENYLSLQPAVVNQSEIYGYNSTDESNVVASEPHASVVDMRSSLTIASEQTDRLRGIKQTDIEFLLKHFRETVVALMAPLPLVNKSAWEVTHVNCAIITLAKTTYMGPQHVSDAAMANLQAVCAIAANHLAFASSMKDDSRQVEWKEIANQIIGQAKNSLQRSLRNETHGPIAAKYKDQLMAISAVMAFAILYDQQKDARAYMVDAERLLRLRGLVKQSISRKCRLLHHCYTWTRIIGESTHVLRTYENAELIAAIHLRSSTTRKRRKVAHSVGVFTGASNQEYRENHNPRLDDFLRLEPNVLKSGRQAMEKKDRTAGLHDIHLEDSREWSEGLYMQLYGISETWLSLVSRTTRLANVLDSISNSRDRKAEFMELLDRRKNRLENMVCSLVSTDEHIREPNPSDTPQQPTQNTREASSTSAQACMVRALNSALVIYFYRRIRNVNPWILQEHVSNVVKALKDFTAACVEHDIPGPGSPWPCFMAGCEAMHATQREYLTQWLDDATAVTGFTRFRNAKIAMEEVWNQRDSLSRGKGRHNLSDNVPSWIDVLRHKKMTLLLS